MQVRGQLLGVCFLFPLWVPGTEPRSSCLHFCSLSHLPAFIYLFIYLFSVRFYISHVGCETELGMELKITALKCSSSGLRLPTSGSLKGLPRSCHGTFRLIAPENGMDASVLQASVTCWQFKDYFFKVGDPSLVQASLCG